MLSECMTVTSKKGLFAYQSMGAEETCGIFLVAAPDELIEVEFEAIDVTCESGLVVVGHLHY